MSIGGLVAVREEQPAVHLGQDHVRLDQHPPRRGGSQGGLADVLYVVRLLRCSCGISKREKMSGSPWKMATLRTIHNHPACLATATVGLTNGIIVFLRCGPLLDHAAQHRLVNEIFCLKRVCTGHIGFILRRGKHNVRCFLLLGVQRKHRVTRHLRDV